VSAPSLFIIFNNYRFKFWEILPHTELGRAVINDTRAHTYPHTHKAWARSDKRHIRLLDVRRCLLAILFVTYIDYRNDLWGIHTHTLSLSWWGCVWARVSWGDSKKTHERTHPLIHIQHGCALMKDTEAVKIFSNASSLPYLSHITAIEIIICKYL